jgi:ketosteroid isomerase-like protein
MDGDQVKQELMRLEHAWMDAVRRRDMELLQRMLGEEYALTTGRPGAEVRSRQEWLEITRNHYVIDSFSFKKFDIHVYGDTAVVRSHYCQKGRMGTLDRSAEYLMTDVWVRRDGRWQAVTRHISPLRSGEGAVRDEAGPDRRLRP